MGLAEGVLRDDLKIRLRHGNNVFVKELIRAVAWAHLHQQLACEGKISDRFFNKCLVG